MMRFSFLIVLATGLAAAAGNARAGEVSPELAKYDKRVDESVEKALAFLAKNQLAAANPFNRPELAGSFNSPGLPGSTGVSSLCIMAFLAKGYTPGNGRYGEVINKGIDYVLSKQQPNGALIVSEAHGPMYSHCISTLMLAEASGMVDPERQKKIDVVLPKALKLILDAQRVPKDANNAGGWQYYPNSSTSDMSLTGWALMALRAARLNGAAVPKQAIDDAVSYILKCRRGDGVFCYTPDHQYPGLGVTGVGVLCLVLCGQHQHEAVRTGGEWILRHMPTSIRDNTGVHCPAQSMFYYGTYYCSHAMFQLGGKYWEAWAPRMYDLLLAAQQPDGSWPVEIYVVPGSAGPVYTTAMAALAMGVVYQQLPIYQR